MSATEAELYHTVSPADNRFEPDNEVIREIYDTVLSGEKLVVIDLFCGAGGMSSGVVRVLEHIADAVDKPVDEIAELIAVNHWDRAIETHEENYPWATHYHSKVQELRPQDIENDDRTTLDPGGTVHLLIGCPDCTYFSSARGGGPKDPDSRATPREILDWVEHLNVRNILFENVPEFRQWGPLDENNEVIEERKGDYFENWINGLTIEGFAVDWTVLNAADFGDATSRERLFVVGRKNSGVSWPRPTHSKDGEEPGTDPWRTAADIIDWSDRGESIWVRDLRDGRRSPLANNTMQRIAEGIRRHADDSLAPFANILEDIGPDDVRELRERVVPAEYAGIVAETLTEPFLVKYYGTSTTSPVESPLGTVTAGGQKYALCTPYLLGQHSNSVARAVDERPTPTVCTGGKISLLEPETFVLGQQSDARSLPVHERPVPTVAKRGAISTFSADPFVLPKNGKQRGLFSNKSYPTDDGPLHTIVAGRIDQGYVVSPSLIHYSHGGARHDVESPLPTIATERGGSFSVANPYLVPFYGERPSQRPRTHSVDAPHPTIPASAIKRGVVSPFLVEYYGNGQAQPVDGPIPTVTTRDRFALVVPELFPLGIDILFRMLKPDELAAAMGFEDYTFAGNKTETVKQIGNAVPVNLAESLCTQLLTGTSPTIDQFTDGVSDGVNADD